MRTYFVYMMTNRSRVVLYTGVTSDLARRIWQHQHGDVPGFTKSYRIDKLVYYESTPDPLSAITREKEIKGWRRSKKNALVDTFNPPWRDLSPDCSGQMRGPSPSEPGLSEQSESNGRPGMTAL